MSIGYPTGSDLSNRITAYGLTPPSLQILNSMADAAASEWEHSTGWNPFLADSQLRYFSLPGATSKLTSLGRGGNRYLQLNSGLLTPYFVKIDNVELVRDSDYFLHPFNAINDNRPYTMIEFSVYRFGNSKTISVSGLFGFTEKIDSHIFETIMNIALVKILPTISVKKYGALTSWKDGEISENYNNTGFAHSGLIEYLKNEVNEAITAHRRFPGW